MSSAVDDAIRANEFQKKSRRDLEAFSKAMDLQSLVNREAPPTDGTRILATVSFSDVHVGQFVIHAESAEDGIVWVDDLDHDVDFRELIHWQPAPDIKKIIEANRPIGEQDGSQD